MPSLPPVNPELRQQVINVYRELLNLGKDYPQGQVYFRHRLHAAFAANAQIRDDAAIRRGIAHAQFIQKEIEALYYLKRYRTLRKRYDSV